MSETIDYSQFKPERTSEQTWETIIIAAQWGLLQKSTISPEEQEALLLAGFTSKETYISYPQELPPREVQNMPGYIKYRGENRDRFFIEN